METDEEREKREQEEQEQEDNLDDADETGEGSGGPKNKKKYDNREEKPVPVDWNTELKKYWDANIMKPEKRKLRKAAEVRARRTGSISRGIKKKTYIQGYTEEEKRKGKPKNIVLTIDTSYSINEEQAKKFIDSARNIADIYKKTDMTVVFWTDEINNVVTLTGDRKKDNERLFNEYGGLRYHKGYTDHTETYDYLKSDKPYEYLKARKDSTTYLQESFENGWIDEKIINTKPTLAIHMSDLGTSSKYGDGEGNAPLYTHERVSRTKDDIKKIRDIPQIWLTDEDGISPTISGQAGEYSKSRHKMTDKDREAAYNFAKTRGIIAGDIWIWKDWDNGQFASYIGKSGSMMQDEAKKMRNAALNRLKSSELKSNNNINKKWKPRSVRLV